jgi:hypothetical protein
MNKSVKNWGKRLFSFENSSDEGTSTSKSFLTTTIMMTILIQAIQTCNFVAYVMNMEPTNCDTNALGQSVAMLKQLICDYI